ncbi:MAG: hypothetical protein SGPRY_014955, partial [Prymnesium sp.]
VDLALGDEFHLRMPRRRRASSARTHIYGFHVRAEGSQLAVQYVRNHDNDVHVCDLARRVVRHTTSHWMCGTSKEVSPLLSIPQAMEHAASLAPARSLLHSWFDVNQWMREGAFLLRPAGADGSHSPHPAPPHSLCEASKSALAAGFTLLLVRGLVRIQLPAHKMHIVGVMWREGPRPPGLEDEDNGDIAREDGLAFIINERRSGRYGCEDTDQEQESSQSVDPAMFAWQPHNVYSYIKGSWPQRE